MDMETFTAIIRRLVQTVRSFFEILGIIQTALWLIGGGAVIGGIIASLQKVPIIVPILLLAVGIGAFVYATVKTIYRYRSWNNLKNIPQLDVVMEKALDIHIHIGKLHDEVIEQNRPQNIKTKLRQRLAKKYLEMAGISLNELNTGVNPDGTFRKKLFRKVRRFYSLKEGDYSRALPLLRDYGRLLDKAKLGLRDAMKGSTEYDQAKNEFMKAQLQLDIPSEAIDYINNLPELSYGLYSLSIGANLPHEGRNWYKHVPDTWKKQSDEARSMVDTAYVKATMWAKSKVRRAMFQESLR